MRPGHLGVSRIGRDRGTCTAEAEAWNPTGATTNQLALVRSINQQPREVSMNTDRCCENSGPRTFAPPLRRRFRLDHSRRDPGATAEMPDVSGSIHRALEWNRAFILRCDTF